MDVGGGGVFVAFVTVEPRVVLLVVACFSLTSSSSSDSSSSSSSFSSSSSSLSSSLLAPRVLTFDLFDCCETGRFGFLITFPCADAERDGGMDRFCGVLELAATLERDVAALEF